MKVENCVLARSRFLGESRFPEKTKPSTAAILDPPPFCTSKMKLHVYDIEYTVYVDWLISHVENMTKIFSFDRYVD